jgi:hypothetical protein
MKNLIIAIVTIFSFVFTYSASANTNIPTPPQYSAASKNAVKPLKITVTITVQTDPIVVKVTIEIACSVAPGGNSNGIGNIIAITENATKKGINEKGLRKGMQEKGLKFNVSPESSQALAGLTDIVVTKGATCPDGTVINVGDTIVPNGASYTVKPSGLPSGRRQYER